MAGGVGGGGLSDALLVQLGLQVSQSLLERLEIHATLGHAEKNGHKNTEKYDWLSASQKLPDSGYYG